MRVRLSVLMLAVVALASPTLAQSPSAGPAPATGRTTFVYKYKTPQLHRAAIDALLTDPSKILFVDLRRPDEVSRNGTFPVYLSAQIKDLEKNLAFIPKDRPIVTVSNHAGRAGQAADLLSEKGFKVIGAVGSQTYEAEGGTIVKVAVPPEHPVPAPASPSTPKL